MIVCLGSILRLRDAQNVIVILMAPPPMCVRLRLVIALVIMGLEENAVTFVFQDSTSFQGTLQVTGMHTDEQKPVTPILCIIHIKLLHAWCLLNSTVYTNSSFKKCTVVFKE